MHSNYTFIGDRSAAKAARTRDLPESPRSRPSPHDMKSVVWYARDSDSWSPQKARLV